MTTQQTITVACESAYVLLGLVEQDEIDSYYQTAGWHVMYYGTASDPKQSQLEEVLSRAQWAPCAHLGVRLPDGSYCVGKIATR